MVATERLIDDLWGERPPRTAHAAVQVYVSQLRKVISSNRLVSRTPGYVLSADAEEVDVALFDRLVHQARAGDDATAARTLRDALSLWRGDALADFRYEPFAQAEIARLEEARLTALEERVEADLALGRHVELVPELEALVSRHPLRERLRGQLMLALYRSGRQADALQVYRDARRTLVDELGIEPSSGLRRLEAQVLAQDAALDVAVDGKAVEIAAGGTWREPSAAEGQAHPLRKTVTVLACELDCSQDDGADPEVVGGTASHYLAVARGTLERHGALVEEMIGNAVVGFFGLDALHEDDALRAVRAAVEIRDSLGLLNSEAEAEGRFAIGVRVGITTRDVVVSDASRPALATGPAVESAVILQRAALPGQILISDATLALVRDRVTVKRNRRSDRKRTLLAPAHAVVGVRTEVSARPGKLHSPLIGRDGERSALRDAFEGTLDNRECRLVTVLGPAGVGKSRLMAEFAAEIGSRARVVRGRCLSYGDGITFFPLAEAVREALGLRPEASLEESRRRLREAAAGEGRAAFIARRVAELLGFADPTGPAEERPWAVRKLLEALARREPLVVVFDDVHWGEPTFLDLVEHVAETSRDAPIMVVCLARPELLEERPRWAEGKRNAPSIVLQPLTRGESEQLIENLLGTAEGVDVAARYVADVAEGNPFFAEELLAMLIERGLLERDEAGWRVIGDASALSMPSTIHAVLAARLDRLPARERATLQRASIEGKGFHAGSVADLTPDEASADVAADLAALAQKELIQPEPATFPNDEGFRFRHQLIRDAAYASLPKASRADLHEQLAAWLERKMAGRESEYEAFLGYHLERAYRYREDLGLVDERAQALAERAAGWLGAAGRTAFARGDMPAAVSLLESAIALLRTDDHAGRAPLLADLGSALMDAGDGTRGELALAEAIEAARRAGDERTAWAARINRGYLRDHFRREGATREGLESALAAVPVLESLGDDRTLALAWRVIGHYRGAHDLRCLEAEDACRRADAHAERAGDANEERAALRQLAKLILVGPTPAAEGIRRCHELHREAGGDRSIEVAALEAVALLEAGRGNLSEARRLVVRMEEICDELGIPVRAGLARVTHAEIAVLDDDPAAAEKHVRAAVQIFDAIGEKPRLAMAAAYLAQILAGQGRDREAERFLAIAEDAMFPDDIFVAIEVAIARAKVRARRGALAEAEEAAREAVRLARSTDALMHTGEALAALADVLRAAGRHHEALFFFEEAARVYEHKGFTVAATKVRRLVMQVRGVDARELEGETVRVPT